jgi:hypothetical protein
MKAKAANPRRLNVLGNVDWLSDREILTAMLKRWRQRLGYCSIFAAIPAILASHLQEARSEEAPKPEASVAGRGSRFLERLNKSFSSSQLLKRQSKFRLPHQKGNFALLAPLGGNDDCPGRAIPGGNYTAAAPYSESGDTTGANDTVTRIPSFYYFYYSYDAHGPDHVYSFTLTGRGPNPQIEVSTTSGTYKPLIYVLKGGSPGACPAGTGNFGDNELVLFDSRWSSTGSTATLDNWAVNYLPLNVPLYLFVDSAFNDAASSGPYTIRIQDVTIAPATALTQNRREAGVFRADTAALFLRNANTSGAADMAFNFGNPGDYPVAGDWNGDGIDTVGSYRNGVFYLGNSNSTSPAQLVIAFGNPGDQPIVGDWNGDGVDTIGVYRNGTFYLRNSNTAGPPDLVFNLGDSGDIAIAGDWNGDGIVTVGVFRPSNGTVHLRNSNSTGFADLAFVFGNAGDLPVAGDWDGDGMATVGVYRAGVFYLRNLNTNGFADVVFAFGNPGDFPLVGDWNGQP